MFRKLAKRYFPAWTTTLRACQVLARETGLLRSCREGQCVNANGEYLPWYTYPAIEMLNQWDFQKCDVFEYGSGNSTLYWSQRAANVFAVEENANWYSRTASRIPANARCQLARTQADYIDAPRRLDRLFDVIVVDGRLREACSRVALEVLRPGGLIILDNSDWYQSAARVLHDADLIEIDFSGFSPLNSFCFTTSFFVHREFRLNSRADRRPAPGVGAVLETREDRDDHVYFEKE